MRGINILHIKSDHFAAFLIYSATPSWFLPESITRLAELQAKIVQIC